MDLEIAHVADHYRRYPGDSLTLHTRVRVLNPVQEFTVRVGLPAHVPIEDYRSAAGYETMVPDREVLPETNYLVWRVSAETPAGTEFEYQTVGRVPPTLYDTTLESTATVTTGRGQARVTATEAVEVAVLAKGRYLQHLPAIYQDDDLMARFLMLFESFWEPIERQLDDTSIYFDTRLMPAEMLPWLASWIGLALDENWPEDRQRLLLRNAAKLYRTRGTKRGLLKFLEIYTGQKGTIIENRAENFTLGEEAKLGPGIALGKENSPNTFVVQLSLPPIEAPTQAEREQLENVRRRTIEAIIRTEKPAHTDYKLQLEQS
jgi:phage tail-like protein